FVTGPVGLASFVLRKPLVLHEQNAVAGMTNRWLSRVADCVLSALPGAFSSRVVTRVVGNPLRKEIEEHAEQMRRNVPQKPTSSSLNVLIIGGSQGARVLNQRVPQAIAQCSFDINVIHQTGVQDEERVRNDYQALCTEGASITSSAFIEDMLQAYRWCDLVICRAGAMTVAELAGAGVPSILVPFPFAVDDHQTKNAQHLTNAGAAILMPELKFTSDALTHELDRLHNDRAALADMAAAARQCYQANATQHVADALTEFCK
ncbi:MAG: UDP-N-acetylglucosamine--N-acetylmuramyl-(pentapeptide) pyrophosphoryl-undecaprenol N-acetylglucosamine transferase, partial [Gammaproteobacteria bacterium]|nr:UDP-N-acetylglucosamine--N-acetylmuramyl-(pentapeptide) pyrophosphoryl-undecaprenol N-acetylglucosamine transferase [Gammaproteobacteria bacterium]